MSFAKPEPKDRDDGPSLLCSVDGCVSRWSVKLDGQMPKCSRHQWQQPLQGNTKTYKQYLEDKNHPAKTVDAWYKKEPW